MIETTEEDRGRREGRAEGLEKGQLGERQKNIRLMHQKGFSVETIAKTLDLSEQDVNDILGL